MLDAKVLLKTVGGSFAVALSLSGGAAQAQDASATEFSSYIEALRQAGATPKNVYLPGVNHAVVAPSGTGFASLTFMNPRDGTAGLGWDASTSFGLGFGSASESIGVSVQANVTGTQPFGTDGDFAIKFSRQVGDSTYIGLGLNRLAGWGTNANVDANAEIMLTHFTEFGSGAGLTPVMVTAGVSTAGSTDQNDPGAFLGIGFGLTENIGMGVSVKNGQVNAGVGIKASGIEGMSFTADVSNVNELNPGSSKIFSFGVHYAFDSLF